MSPNNTFVQQKKPNKLLVFVKNKVLPALVKFGNARHVAGIRDAFGTMIPLIIAGSIGILISSIVFGGNGSGYVSLFGLICKLANPHLAWSQISEKLGDTTNVWGKVSTIFASAFTMMSSVTIGMMSIYFAFLYAYFLAQSKKNKTPIIAGLLSIGAFILICMGQINFFMDAKGLITAIIFTIITTEIFCKLCNVRAFNLKLPDSVPPAVGKSFQVFLPAVFTLGILAILNIVILAPAIVTNGLNVTSMQYATLDGVNNVLPWGIDVSAWDGTQWASSNPDLIKTLADKLNGNHADFAGWISTLSSSDNAFVTTAIAYVTPSINFAGSLASITSHARMTLIWDPTLASGVGDYVASLNWQYIAIGSSAFGWGEAIYQFFTSWFIGFATSSGGLGLAIIFCFFVSFFWFFGVHGSNVMAGIFEPIWWMILGINTALITSMGYPNAVNTGSLGIFTKPFFDSYMYIGGSGATLGLLVATFAVSKRRDLKEIAKYATPAGVFQINEPTIFGYPLILNPVYVTPFIIAPIANLMVAWIFSPEVLNFVNYSYIAIPWTTPWILGGVLTSLDPRALVPAIICFAIDLTLYLPFVFLDNRLFFKRIKLSDRDLYFKELRYSYNAKDHYITQTEEKYQAKIQKANNVVTIANNRNEFIKSLRLKQARKDSIVSKNLHKAELRKTKLLKEAEDYKKNRNQRYNLIENKLTLRNKNLVKKINQKYWRLYKKTNLHNNISQRSIRIKETNLDLLNILSETTANV